MTNEVDFDELSRKAMQSNGAMQDLNNLYGHAFALPVWHFIARGEFPDVNPYIASNAEFAGGQQMVRAFTDTDRLLRFAKENNLTDADGGAANLSIPTEKIVEYLEQFITDGVHGIWFNSDTESDGFFVPLKQLRPIKEHLERLNLIRRDEPKKALETLIIIVKDGLMLPSGFVAPSSFTCNIYCRVPNDWVEGGRLKESHLEKFFEKLYGDNWRMGNSDGSRYVVQDQYSQLLTADAVKRVNWSITENTKDAHFLFYIVSETGEIQKITPLEFQREIDSSFQAAAPEKIADI